MFTGCFEQCNKVSDFAIFFLDLKANQWKSVG